MVVDDRCLLKLWGVDGMNKLTQIAGVDNKIGRNSRTGSTISIIVPDDLILDVTSYYLSVKANKEPTENIKKIELVMYTDDDLKADYTNKLFEMEKELEEVIQQEIKFE